jgi:hypothetical protein
LWKTNGLNRNRCRSDMHVVKLLSTRPSIVKAHVVNRLIRHWLWVYCFKKFAKKKKKNY